VPGPHPDNNLSVGLLLTVPSAKGTKLGAEPVLSVWH